MQVPPVENPTCSDFKEYEEVPKTAPLDFIEDDVMWVASNISGTTCALGAEGIEPMNFLIYFGCALEELRVIIANLDDWMDNSSPPWYLYCALMSCSLIALDKRTGVCSWE